MVGVVGGGGPPVVQLNDPRVSALTEWRTPTVQGQSPVGLAAWASSAAPTVTGLSSWRDQQDPIIGGLTSWKNRQDPIIGGLTSWKNQQDPIIGGLTSWRDQQNPIISGLTSWKDQTSPLLATYGRDIGGLNTFRQGAQTKLGAHDTDIAGLLRFRTGQGGIDQAQDYGIGGLRTRMSGLDDSLAGILGRQNADDVHFGKLFNSGGDFDIGGLGLATADQIGSLNRRLYDTDVRIGALDGLIAQLGGAGGVGRSYLDQGFGQDILGLKNWRTDIDRLGLAGHGASIIDLDKRLSGYGSDIGNIMERLRVMDVDRMNPWDDLGGGMGGANGADGAAGAQGLQGIQGIQGLRGETGLTGEIGLRGEQGLRGETGLGFSQENLDSFLRYGTDISGLLGDNYRQDQLLGEFNTKLGRLFDPITGNPTAPLEPGAWDQQSFEAAFNPFREDMTTKFDTLSKKYDDLFSMFSQGGGGITNQPVVDPALEPGGDVYNFNYPGMNNVDGLDLPDWVKNYTQGTDGTVGAYANGPGQGQAGEYSGAEMPNLNLPTINDNSEIMKQPYQQSLLDALWAANPFDTRMKEIIDGPNAELDYNYDEARKNIQNRYAVEGNMGSPAYRAEMRKLEEAHARNKTGVRSDFAMQAAGSDETIRRNRLADLGSALGREQDQAHRIMSLYDTLNRNAAGDYYSWINAQAEADNAQNRSQDQGLAMLLSALANAGQPDMGAAGGALGQAAKGYADRSTSRDNDVNETLRALFPRT